MIQTQHKRQNLMNRLKQYDWTLKDMEQMTDRELSKQIVIEEYKRIEPHPYF